MMQGKDIGSLLHKVSVALDRTSDQVLQERLGIGLAQFRVLLFLLQNDGAKQAAIAENLSQTEASISRQVKILQEKKLAVVRRNVSSRRDRLVFLTQKGAATSQRSLIILNEYHAPMFDNIGQKQQEELVKTLQIINGYVKD